VSCDWPESRHRIIEAVTSYITPAVPHVAHRDNDSRNDALLLPVTLISAIWLLPKLMLFYYSFHSFYCIRTTCGL
jgi:hypothetical protein